MEGINSLEELWSQFYLSKEEHEPLLIVEDDSSKDSLKMQRSLVGKIIWEQIVPKDII